MTMDQLRPAFGPLIALSTHLIGIPAIVAHELKEIAVCWRKHIVNMLGDGGDEVARGENLEPTEGRQPARTCRSEQSERQLEPYLGVHA